MAKRFTEARETFEAVDDALGFALSTLMWEGPDDELTQTHNAQPAILAHSLAVHAVVGACLEPVAAAGHSLGEYSAYAASGALSTAEAARLVRRRGELMRDAGKARTGAMSAVIGLDAESVERVCREASTDHSVVVGANLNAPDQIVISGDPVAVERAGELLKERGARRVLPLKVSGAFHSPLMEPAQRGLREELESVTLGSPRFPVIANASATAVTDPAEATQRLGDQLTSPVRWVESMTVAVATAGADTPFLELGPGNVLSGLLRRIDRSAAAMALGTADQVSAFMEQQG